LGVHIDAWHRHSADDLLEFGHCLCGDRSSFLGPLRDRLKPFKWRFGDLYELPRQCVSAGDGQMLKRW